MYYLLRNYYSIRYLSSFKDFVTQQIGELIDYSSTEELSKWIGSQLENTADFNAALRKMPTITGVLNNMQLLNLKTLTKLDEIRWTRYKNIIKNFTIFLLKIVLYGRRMHSSTLF